MQSVRLTNHEISEIQRWEAFCRSKGKPEPPPAILDPSSSPSAQNHGSLAPNPKDDKSTSPSSATGKGDGSILGSVGSASSPGGKSSTGDGYLSSPSRLHGSPDRLAGSRYVCVFAVLIGAAPAVLVAVFGSIWFNLVQYKCVIPWHHGIIFLIRTAATVGRSLIGQFVLGGGS